MRPVLALACLCVAALAAAPGHPVRLHGIRFTSPLPFSAPSPAGLDALTVVHPKEARPGTERMSLTAVRFAAGEPGMTDGELIEYVKSTFLATTAPGKPQARSFLGRKVPGNVVDKKIPAPARAETYLVPLKGGARLVLGFVYAPDFAPQAEAAIAQIAASMAE